MQTVHRHRESSNGVHEHRAPKVEELSEFLQPL